MKDYPIQYVPSTMKICSSYPYQLMAADLVTLPGNPNGYVGCLVVVDHYSKWVSAVPIRNKTAAAAVRAFERSILPYIHTTPTSIFTDNGKEFDNYEFHMPCMKPFRFHLSKIQYNNSNYQLSFSKLFT